MVSTFSLKKKITATPKQNKTKQKTLNSIIIKEKQQENLKEQAIMH